MFSNHFILVMVMMQLNPMSNNTGNKYKSHAHILTFIHTQGAFSVAKLHTWMFLTEGEQWGTLGKPRWTKREYVKLCTATNLSCQRGLAFHYSH